jgi:hypothetical protein
MVYLYLASAPYHESCGQSQQGSKRSTSLNFVCRLTDRPAVGLPGALVKPPGSSENWGSCRNGDSNIAIPASGSHSGFFKRVCLVQYVVLL